MSEQKLRAVPLIASSADIRLPSADEGAAAPLLFASVVEFGAFVDRLLVRGSVVLRAAFDPQHPYFRTRRDGPGKLLCSATSLRICAFDDNPQDWEVHAADGGSGQIVHVVSPHVADRLNEQRKDDAKLRDRHAIARSPDGASYLRTEFVSIVTGMLLRDNYSPSSVRYRV